MYLKSITLKGFKSFPDRTALEFGPGVSVIVGPNGSGKSNVTDAVMWALGEQSPVAVRGHSMQDVIFAGAAGRQATREAEVELVLDDSEGTLALGVAEISVSRRLDRTGEGEYRLAGARCRLVDVIEMLSDTGLGREMHSVISQGRIESIVTSKPRERRLLIEEAAGLGKHRKRRRRVQLKLARTQDNLDRALDVEREARSRLRPLKRQAEAAELHARLERQMLEARWELASAELGTRREALMEAQAASARARARRAEVERELHAVAGRRQAAEEALAGRSAEREQLSERCFAARAAGERVADRVQAARAAAAAVRARLVHGQERLAALDPEIGGDVPDAESAARIAVLEDSLAALQRDRELELSRELTELEERSGAAASEVARQSTAVRELGEARERAEERVRAARAALHEAERAVEGARRQAARVGGELAGVNQFLRGQAGMPGGSSVSALADELEVEAGYELALAAALDGRLRAAIVSDRASAGAVLDRAGADGGRALLSRGDLAACAADQARPTAGAERLAEHVRGRDDAVAVCRALLSDTWVVDDLEAVPDRFAGVVVTRAGRVWSASGQELRQAPAMGQERVLAQRNRRECLVAASEAAAQAERAAAAALDGAAATVTEVSAQGERAVTEHRQAVDARDEAAELQRRIAAAIDRRRSAPDEGRGAGRRAQLTAELALERGALERAERERAERRSRIARVHRAIARDQALGPLVSAVAEALEEARGAIAQQRSSFEVRLKADREAGEHLAAELRTCAQHEAKVQAQLQGENETLTTAEVRTQQVRDQAAEAEGELRALAARLAVGAQPGLGAPPGLDAQPPSSRLSAQERDALTGRLQRLVRRREQLGPVNPLAQQEYAQALEHVEELECQRCDLEQALRELQKLIADTDRQIRETFEQTFDDAARSFEELAGVLFPGGAGRLRLLGDQASFAQRLGGEPEVREDGDGEDLFGVEIEITPAGKDCKRLSLLSGGEKSMTALAFLFAVFLARPCPFYILDEVEAALDDLNIERFLGLLRRYSTRAQFIVVTHQKRTMEAADSLYGVSMGADGVSKVISRRLPAQAAAERSPEAA